MGMLSDQAIAEINARAKTPRFICQIYADDVAALLADREGWRGEAEELRRLGCRQREEIQKLHGMADAVERLREIGRATGCDHVDDPDGRAKLVNCVETTIADLEEKLAASYAMENEYREVKEALKEAGLRTTRIGVRLAVIGS